MNKRVLRIASLLLTINLSAVIAFSQTKITSPKEQVGFNFGDDYQLANYTQLVDYWKKLAQQSDRMKLVLADRHKLVLRSDSNRGLGCLAAAVADRVVKSRPV